VEAAATESATGCLPKEKAGVGSADELGPPEPPRAAALVALYA
jgi:hypothetical protein